MAIVISLCLFMLASFVSAETLILTIASVHETTPYVTKDHQGILDKLYAEAFKRVGKKVIIQPVFPARGIYQANHGTVDGEALRIEGIELHYTNLIRVPEIVWEGDASVFTNKRRTDIKPHGWQSLEGYRIGYLNGWLFPEPYIGGFNNIHKSNYLSSLIDMVEHDRLDVFIHLRLVTLYYLKKQGNTSVKELKPVLAKLPLYLYLHKRHARLVPDLIKALQTMKKDGTYQSVYDMINCQLALQHDKRGC
ncbi:transporter substrate-binding domain-containing protein [Zooshikella marina]|uniref:substrate-binding periplasmic protein n=1 Tax=Zooshikella ganghwensis TaxID=202772 RepID=UPI001BAFAFF1|nr:transporter substrate-binding domain-containing protein [Zooshikella ganghwensis]MBU2708450.1 transporter substrate-binding domain-containing protein [Zooshikella ganghwensis]